MFSQNSREILAERYKIQEELGKKVGRCTLLAQDLKAQESVVIKLLNFSDEFEWNHLKLFEREAETLKSLNHPAIPRYIDYFEIDSTDYKGFALVQSYIPAKSLDQQLKAGRNFSETDVKQLATSLLGILKYLHERQPPVIHRDIKPSNILLTNRTGNSVGDVYLVDFGSVQTITRSQRSSTMTVVGTYGYMSPEQFHGKANPSSDIYSLGATLIFLVTGQQPNNLPQVDLRIQFDKFANISPTLSRWLQKMTEPIASKRFSSVIDALKALDTVSDSNLTLSKTDYLSLAKPVGSKITLSKNSDFIEILIPAIAKSVLTYLLPSFFPLGIILFIVLSSIFGTTYNSITLFLFIAITCSFIPPLTFNLAANPGYKRLYINKKEIALLHEILGIRRHSPLPSPRQHIIRLERTKDNHNQPCLFIWAGTQKYAIFTGDNYIFAVTPPELDWIAEELSNWLELAITRE